MRVAMATRAFVGILGIALLIGLSGCARQETLEAKRQRLAQLQAELAQIQQQIAQLEQELGIAATGSGEAISVVAQPARLGSLQRVLEVQGQVESRTTVALSTKLGGTVAAVRVQPGQRVRAGTVLVELDSEVLQRSLEEAELQRDYARTLYERYARAWEAKAIAEVQYLTAKQQLEAAERRVATLREQLRQARIVAPFDGIVDEVNARVGEFLAPGVPAVRLFNLRNVYVSAELSEAYLEVLRVGMPVQVVLRELADTLPGRVSVVGKAISPRTRTVRLEIQLQRIPEALRPGLECSVRFAELQRPQAVLVPLAALRRRNAGETVVYVVQRGNDHGAIVQERAVRVGIVTGGEAEILSGVRPNELVVVRAAGELRNGMLVKL
jgi:membrane fusion protein (multidrug efflux system)